MDKIVNYRDLAEKEKDNCLAGLRQTSFCAADRDTETLKKEMEKSVQGRLPQFVFVLRDGKVIGYLFLIAEKENNSRVFPWWETDNSDELPPETDLRLLAYGIQLCREAECRKLEKRLQFQAENHRNGIGRRPAESSL